MKYFRYIILGIVFTVCSCEDVLDKKPLDLIPDTEVWHDEALAEAFLNDIYLGTEFVNLRNDRGYNQAMVASMGGECRVYGAWQRPYQASTAVINENGARDAFEYWNYENVRNANYFIEQMETVSTLDPEYIEQKVSEARFLRAYMYFQMVIRYGGVPLVTKALPLNASEEEIFVSRNSEKEIYDFIGTELDAISQILPDAQPDGNSRPTKWAALAFKSRAMLYAASIGKWGTQQLDGLLGIPAGEVGNYAQKAYDAAKQVIEQSGHQLYDVNPDKVQNFHDLFIDGSDANPEIIMSQKFAEGTGYGHSLSNRAMPDGFAKGWGSNFNIFYDFVELFEFEDGRPGNSISREQLTSQEWTMDELFHSRDPRFKASIFYPEASWQGSQVLFHSSTMVNGESINSGTIEGDWPAKAPNRNTTKTGFHLKKRIDENAEGPLSNEDDTDYYVFRLGEMYLNMAEAALYLGGKDQEAMDAVNMIRKRAGLPDKNTVDHDIVRQERQVEFFFEDHRYWDLKRWRIAHEVLDGVRLQGLRYDFNWDTKKYIISFKNAEGVERTFQERHYYLPINVKRLAENANLIENPGYTGG